jgi:hypothetical protein
MSITVEMVKKHLPDDISVKEYEKNIFICSFPETYQIAGEDKNTAFAVCFNDLELSKNISNDEQLDELIAGRCKVGYQQGLNHHKKYVKYD